jgi:S1-C subfamily serine protease
MGDRNSGMDEQFTPILPPSTPVSQGSASAAGSPAVSPATASSPVTGPADRAGESIDPAAPTISSRPPRDRRLAGVLAASLLSASVASAVTVSALMGAGAIGGRATPATAAVASSAASTATTTSTGSVNLTANDAVVAVAESASPAVVTLTVESAGQNGFGPLSMPSTGVGSGFIYDASGLILTNHHVIEGSGTITVTFQDGTEMPGTVVADDPTRDLAVVKVDKAGLPTIPVGSSRKLQVGQLVVAIGSPLGQFTETVTSGILSATGRTIEVGSDFSRQTKTMTGLLQTDAAINEGNSGGPLLDANGNVVGVDVAVAASAQGIGFAIPIDDAAAIMAKARTATGAT